MKNFLFLKPLSKNLLVYEPGFECRFKTSLGYVDFPLADSSNLALSLCILGTLSTEKINKLKPV